MVTYKLLSKGEKSMQYAYWPEGHEDKEPGIIVVDFEKELVYVKKPAEEEPRIKYKAERPCEYRESWNEWLRIEGKPLLKENDWPSKRQSLCHYHYAQYAIRMLIRHHNAGEMPDEGYNIWY